VNIEEHRQLVNELIDKKKWQEIIARFLNVLKINIFLVDFEGQVLLPPSHSRYGWTFFSKACLGLKNLGKNPNILGKFKQNNGHLEYRCESGLHSFALPLSTDHGDPIVYLMIGPVILNRKEEAQFYEEIAEEMNFDLSELISAVSEIRVVSHITMKSILELLAEVGKDVVEFRLEKQKLSKMKINEMDLPKDISQTAQEIYTTIHLDEMLITLLDLALKMTNTECGSIMVLDDKNKEMTVKVSRGINQEKVKEARIKVGEGIAGLAAKENSSFVIHGTQGESRIQKYLNRSDIKHSIVMPLTTKRGVFGVLNVHTKKENLEIESSFNNLQYLSKLISAAFQSI